MENLIINYDFNALEVDNTVGTNKLKFSDSTLVSGPGKTSIGTYPRAVDLGSIGKASADLSNLNLNKKRFTIQVVFKVKSSRHASRHARQNIVESNFLPFALYVTTNTSLGNKFELVSSINVNKYGWSKVDNKFKKTLNKNKWYTASIVYDHDTLGIFVDDELISVHGFPKGTIKTNTTTKLFFGTWVDGVKNHFNGCLAGFKWFNGIPANMESLLDEKRSDAEWHITYKRVTIKNKISSGKRVQKIKYDSATGSYLQHYERCGIMYHESVGIAFEMHGGIYNKYKSMTKKSELGYLLTDESKATNRNGRKNLFSKGGIYWSSQTGAKPVLNQIYLEYENLGESKAFGFPTNSELTVPGGKEQRFQGCRMYYKNGTAKAQEVHGAILTKYLQKGGVRKWGFPVTNEFDVKKGTKIKGKFSEFESCTIYWSTRTGAFMVLGDIRRKYNDIKGPLGDLGFPTSDEVNIPNHAGAGKMNTFEKGSILWYGSFNSIIVARPFKIRLQRIDSRENEGAGMGQNDLYFRVKIKDGAQMLHNKRYPSGGDYGNHNIKNFNLTFPVEVVPNKINKKISFYIKIMDNDPSYDPNGDDHLGTHTTILNASNAWGYRQPNLVFNQSFSKIKSLLWSIRPKININSLSEVQKWWGFDNFKTPTISWNQCATAFRDVDSETEWWDVTDWLQKAFYEIAVKGVASGGNCFGMSLEAIYARKNMSLFNQPLNEIIENGTSKNEINIKHTYQVGAGPIWWFLGQFASGNTHDPKDVFNETRNAFHRGAHPVVCISQNYDFSGGPHCILPIAWNSNVNPWEMSVMDPNKPNEVRKLFVNPSTNSYSYQGASRSYNGSAWSGGRLHYMPFTILNTPQRTPVWDAILLLLSGTILILADDAETVSIKDANGKDIDGNGSRAKSILKAGHKPEEFFASYTGFDIGNSIKPGQILLRKGKLVSNTTNVGVINVSALPVGNISTNSNIIRIPTAIVPTSRDLTSSIRNRSAHHLLNDPKIANNISVGLKDKLVAITKFNNNRNYVHKVKGVRNGKFDYVIKSGLSEINIKSTIKNNEANTIKVNDLSTNNNKIEFISANNKNVNIEIVNKLGLDGDHINMLFKNIPVKANKPLGMNIKHGIAGLEFENKGVETDISVKFSGKVNGKTFNKSFIVPFKDSVRIKPSSIINSNILIASDITKIFGIIKKTSNILKLNN